MQKSLLPDDGIRLLFLQRCRRSNIRCNYTKYGFLENDGQIISHFCTRNKLLWNLSISTTIIFLVHFLVNILYHKYSHDNWKPVNEKAVHCVQHFRKAIFGNYHVHYSFYVVVKTVIWYTVKYCCSYPEIMIVKVL